MSKKLTYQTHGTCSKAIELELDDEGRIAMCHFVGGCAGNTTGMKPTSCPDQLCHALREIVAM